MATNAERQARFRERRNEYIAELEARITALRRTVVRQREEIDQLEAEVNRLLHIASRDKRRGSKTASAPSDLAPKLGKLIRHLGNRNEGEKMNALAAIDRLLKRHGKDYLDLANWTVGEAS